MPLTPFSEYRNELVLKLLAAVSVTGREGLAWSSVKLSGVEVTPVGRSEIVTATVPENPLSGAIVTEKLVEPPAGSATCPGLADRVKSGRITGGGVGGEVTEEPPPHALSTKE